MGPVIADYEVIATGLDFPEGPVALADGTVLVVEIPRGTLSRVGLDGTQDVVAHLGGGPNGAAIGPDGAVWVCNTGGCLEWETRNGLTIARGVSPTWAGGYIQRVDLRSGDAEVVYRASSGRPLQAPNDLVFDGLGGFWFTDHGARNSNGGRGTGPTGLHYALADGSSCVEAVSPLDAPNGIGLSSDGETLYATETYAGRLWRWRLAGAGQVEGAVSTDHGGTLVAELPGRQLLDSLAVDGEDWVCVGTLVKGGVTVFAPDGRVVDHLPLPDPLVTNICFGGSDRRDAFVTLSGTGRLVRVRWPRPGLRLAHEV